MKKIYFILLLVSELFAVEIVPKYVPNIVPENMGVKTKKKRFYVLVAPAVAKVHFELWRQYERIRKDIKNGTNLEEIEKLKADYSVQTDEELLGCLKPHPQSIVLAQAAMESSWATSRFFVEANNIFGMWSANHDEPRIAAEEKRGGTKVIWLRKFDTVLESVRAYYQLLATGTKFQEFRALRLQTNNPHSLVKELDEYSEIGQEYGKELSHMIRFNKLERFDSKR